MMVFRFSVSARPVSVGCLWYALARHASWITLWPYVRHFPETVEFAPAPYIRRFPETVEFAPAPYVRRFPETVEFAPAPDV